MESIFRKQPPSKAPTVYDLIQAEVEHLKSRNGSVREGENATSKSGAWLVALAVTALLGLFFMDPILYSFYKSDAIRTYIYLHNYDSPATTTALVNSNIFTENEIATMNEQRGSFQSYFTSPLEAQNKAESIVTFMNGMKALRTGRYEDLDSVGKLRYLLFVRIGLVPPTIWAVLNPSVD
jgi:hypothetical protein